MYDFKLINKELFMKIIEEELYKVMHKIKVYVK